MMNKFIECIIKDVELQHYQIVKLEGKDNATVNFMSSAKARFNNLDLKRDIINFPQRYLIIIHCFRFDIMNEISNSKKI